MSEDAGEVLSSFSGETWAEVKPVTGVTVLMQPTMELCWKYPWHGRRVLQQLWRDKFSGDTEWRDVPDAEDE